MRRSLTQLKPFVAGRRTLTIGVARFVARRMARTRRAARSTRRRAARRRTGEASGYGGCAPPLRAVSDH
ncbi:hypothetical protein C7S17_7002 [Burkholderia thailandensis]|nr:hypothetical protein [Burkholderia thailandensis]